MAHSLRDDRWPVLRFDDIPVPGGRLSLRAHAGELVLLQGASDVARLRLLAMACAHAFGGPGRCHVDGEDTRTLDAAGREALRARCVARALQFDSLTPQVPLLLAVAQLALRNGLPAPAALHRASVELERLGLDQAQAQPAEALDEPDRRLALLARALVCRPQLLVLENPDHGQGPAGRATVRRVLATAAEQGTCVFYTAEHPSLSVLASRHVEIGRPALEPA